MNEAERKKQDELEANGLAPKLRALVMSFCAPIWWEIGQKTVLGNATMCVLKTPAALFGVTNNHVLTIYEKHKSEHPDAFCQLGSGPFDPVANVVARSEHWDWATFQIPDETLRHWGHEVFVARDWPPAPIKKGDAVIVGGYPENRRSQPAGPKPAVLNVDFVSFRALADNWSDEHMSFCFDSNLWYWPQGVALEPHPDLSGASGGPCFRLLPDENRIELAGFIYEAGSEYEVIRVRQASLISADGQIATPPLGTRVVSRHD